VVTARHIRTMAEGLRWMYFGAPFLPSS